MKKRMYINRLIAVAWIFASLGLACPVFAGDSNAVKYDPNTLKEGQSYHGLIITYKTDGAEFYAAGSAESASADELLKKVHIAVDKAKILKSDHPLAFHYHHRLASGAHLVRADHALTADEARDLIQQIASDPAVDFVEPEFWLKANDDSVVIGNAQAKPNDEFYDGTQWDYLAADGADFYDSRATLKIANYGGANIEKAWALADGNGITIASLDTGITRHPDLRTELADVGYDFISSALRSGRSTDTRAAGAWDTGDWTTGDAYLKSHGGCIIPNDPTKQPHLSSWHGTHVFGTVGGEATGNGIGLAGVAYHANVLPVRVLGHCGGSNADIADAIIWASGGYVTGVPTNAHPAQVLSLSLGGKGACDARSALGHAIDYATQRGTVVVVAAGNADQDVAGFSPANCANVIAVAAVGITGKRASYSNYGSLITLAAPGGGAETEKSYSGYIWSAGNNGKTTSDQATYVGMTGTSQATPHVAGAVALLQSYRHALGKALLSPAQVSVLLKSTAKPVKEPEAAKPIGVGLLDAYEAVRQAAILP